jgi:hypothetical protein
MPCHDRVSLLLFLRSSAAFRALSIQISCLHMLDTDPFVCQCIVRSARKLYPLPCTKVSYKEDRSVPARVTHLFSSPSSFISD